ncbi:hypothetical protein AB0E08_13625 [Streptomyces sp. NPDC048281]|uniref:hypothetical protein n=1 Tax=Streptomyces sp. NPDC048281 TaxID=3154715 RepID=UPI003435FD95
MLPDGAVGWVITRHKDLRTLLTDPRFSANRSHPGCPSLLRDGRRLVASQVSVAGLPFAFPFPFPTSATSLRDDGMRPADPRITLLGADGREHRDARRALVGEFTPGRMTTLDLRIQRVVDDHVYEVSAGPRRADLVRELALPVPALGPSARFWEFRP